jgi:thioredoxin-related protein
MKRLFLALSLIIPNIGFAELPKLDYVEKPTIGEDGLYKSSIVHMTTMDLKKDYTIAKQQEKVLIIVFEQIGCVYCKAMHTQVFTDKDVNKKMTEDFYMVQLNLGGIKPLKRFDGSEISERDLRRELGVMGTPTFVFFDTSKETNEITNLLDEELLRIPGAIYKDNLLKLLDEITVDAK